MNGQFFNGFALVATPVVDRAAAEFHLWHGDRVIARRFTGEVRAAYHDMKVGDARDVSGDGEFWIQRVRDDARGVGR